MRRLFRVGLLALLALGCAAQVPGPLRVGGLPAGRFEGRFLSLRWGIGGLLELHGTDAGGKAFTITIEGVPFSRFPAQSIASIGGERNDLPDGPAVILRFFDGGGLQTGVIATGFRFRYAPFGSYKLEPTEQADRAVLITPESGKTILAKPGDQLTLAVGDKKWVFHLIQAKARTPLAAPAAEGRDTGLGGVGPIGTPPQSANEGPAFFCDFYAFELP